MNKIKKLLMKHEGFRGKPYLCSRNKKTIGFGRNIDDVGFSNAEKILLRIGLGRDFESEPMTRHEANFLLDNDIFNSIQGAKRLGIDFESLDDVRKNVIVNMTFNLGLGKLRKFKRTLKYLKERRYADTSVEMLDSKWALQVNERATELSEMMKTGAYS